MSTLSNKQPKKKKEKRFKTKDSCAKKGQKAKGKKHWGEQKKMRKWETRKRPSYLSTFSEGGGSNVDKRKKRIKQRSRQGVRN